MRWARKVGYPQRRAQRAAAAPFQKLDGSARWHPPGLQKNGQHVPARPHAAVRRDRLPEQVPRLLTPSPPRQRARAVRALPRTRLERLPAKPPPPRRSRDVPRDPQTRGPDRLAARRAVPRQPRAARRAVRPDSPGRRPASRRARASGRDHLLARQRREGQAQSLRDRAHFTDAAAARKREHHSSEQHRARSRARASSRAAAVYPRAYRYRARHDP